MNRLLLDLPADEPSSDFQRYAETLSLEILNASPACFTAGIFGGFGSGKTTLMQLIKNRLDKKSPQTKMYTVWFDAWRFDREEYLLVPFLLNLREQLTNAMEDPNSRSDVSNILKKVAASIIRGFNFTMGPINFDGDKVVQGKGQDEVSSDGFDSAATTYFKSIMYLKSLTRPDEKENYRLRVAVFIDDLDRCAPSKAFALIEALKSILDIDGYIFIVGLDERVIQSYLIDKYGKNFGISAQEYLEKIFQLPFYIPAYNSQQLPDDVASYLGAIDSGKAEHFKKLIKFLPQNIRKIKRIINRHRILSSFIDADQSVLMLALLIFQSNWPSLFTDMAQIGEPYFHQIYHYENSPEPNPDSTDPVAQSVHNAMMNDEFNIFFNGAMRKYLMEYNKAKKILAYLPLLGKPIASKHEACGHFTERGAQ
jgi:hypothetical protein